MFWLGLTAISAVIFVFAVGLFVDVWRLHHRDPSVNSEHGLVLATVFMLAGASLAIAAYTRQFPIGDLNLQAGTFLRGDLLLGVIYILLRHPRPVFHERRLVPPTEHTPERRDPPVHQQAR